MVAVVAVSVADEWLAKQRVVAVVAAAAFPFYYSYLAGFQSFYR